MVQLAHNSSFSTTVKGTPFFLMFGRPARLTVDVILGIPYEGSTADTEELAQQTRGFTNCLRTGTPKPVGTCVCVLHIKPFFPPVDIQHIQCPCRFFLLKRYKLSGHKTTTRRYYYIVMQEADVQQNKRLETKRYRRTPCFILTNKL